MCLSTTARNDFTRLQLAAADAEAASSTITGSCPLPNSALLIPSAAPDPLDTSETVGGFESPAYSALPAVSEAVWIDASPGASLSPSKDGSNLERQALEDGTSTADGRKLALAQMKGKATEAWERTWCKAC